MLLKFLGLGGDQILRISQLGHLQTSAWSSFAVWHVYMQVLEFVAKRIQNEQAPVVNAVLSTVCDELPVELIGPTDAPHLMKMRDDALSAMDCMEETREDLATLSLHIVRRRFRVLTPPQEGALLQFAMDTLYR